MRALWWRLVRFGFRLLYYELAFTYDLVSAVVSLGAWRCWQRSALPYLQLPNASGARVLEIAHGTGNLQLDLVRLGYQRVASDLSPAMGRIARAKLRRQRQSAALVRNRAQSLPFADASFDALVSTFPTDFIIDPATLREAHRVLRPGGCYVIVLNGQLTGGDAVARFLEWLYRITGQRGNAKSGSRGDVTHFFAGYGFEVSAHTAACRRSVAELVVLRKANA